MPRPLQKTAATSLKMTPEVRDLWEQCAAAENRSLTNMFETMVRAYARTLNVVSTTAAPERTAKRRKKSAPKKD
ncbi:hypothetical protein AVXHC19_40980 [Acidovorax sacchari]